MFGQWPEACEVNVEMPPAPSLRHVGGDESRRWKTVSLKINGGGEEILVPMMQASTVYEVRSQLADALSVDVSQVDILEKSGCKLKKMRNSEQIASACYVRGINSFSRRVVQYPHPFGIIGGGHLGLRQALHWARIGIDFTLFERKTGIGGNAWNGIANEASKLQSEGPHYQLDWDAVDGGTQAIMNFNQYSYWPLRDRILSHFNDVVTKHNLWPSMLMSTLVTAMQVSRPPHVNDETLKTYKLTHVNVGDRFERHQDAVRGAIDDEKVPAKVSECGDGPEKKEYVCSCLAFFPGALAAPHRQEHRIRIQ